MASIIERERSAAGRPSGDRVARPGGTRSRRVAVDRIARWIVVGGGLAIVASILGILVFILWVVAPLLGPARVEPAGATRITGARVGAIVVDEYRTHIAALAEDGVIRVIRRDDGAVEVERALTAPRDGSGASAALSRIQAVPGRPVLAGVTHDGRVAAIPVGWSVGFDDTRRVVTPSIGSASVFDLDPSGGRLGAFAVQISGESAAAAAQTNDGTVALLRVSVEENAMTGEVTRSESRHVAATQGRTLTALVLDHDMRNLYGGAASGEILWWTLSEDGAAGPAILGGPGARVTALGLLTGDRSLVIGREDGTISIWFQVRGADQKLVLTHVRDLPSARTAVVAFAPSPRNKGFLALDSGGGLGLYHSTTERLLWSGPSPAVGSHALAFAPKSDGAFVVGASEIAALAIDNPHPEVSLGTLFRRIWYEGYPEPAWVWQSTGGSDEFESKLSLTPLAYGTLKATIYSMLLAIPLAVLGAMYAAHFMHPSLKRVVKPTVEIMAALPSVVLGFLGGLWLAPLMERQFPSLLLMVVVLPVLTLLAGVVWRRLDPRIRERLPAGSEVALYAIAIALGAWACLVLGPTLESLAFGGAFSDWLLEATGLKYDQRNAVVVGIAMGFAVIPIIFAIAEDAFSNVPMNLVSGSLALGANRWQTVTRVVLPTASPGIFSAIIVGFGRAIGETMIVLMATGNTPIMDWSPFNGFRTLSANIAVEIPEAPVGGTLYRTLFLAALLLFVVTFLVNTAAELIRQRLRRRYAQL